MTGETTRWLDNGIGVIDLHHRGLPKLIAAYVLRSDDGLVLIETGPGSTLDNLFDGLAKLGLDPAELRHILLTHIHLDHAGAAGSLLQRFPESRLYVHERGARHMIDPSRLLQSAERIYGALMGPLWGEFRPCPEEQVTVLTDGDQVRSGDLTLDVLYTPGHASHHVAFSDPGRNVVFAGDVAGVRIPPSSLVWPPTPPPDIDIEAWHASIDRLRDLHPQQLLIAHFGPYDDVSRQLQQLDERLDEWTSLASGWLEEGLEREEMIALLEEHVVGEIERTEPSTDSAEAAKHVTPFGMSVDGLTRYVQRRNAG